MYRTLVVLVVAFAVALGLVGLTFSAWTPPVRADFVFVNGTEPQSLDPHKMKGQPEGRIGDALFEGLTRKDGATFEPVPGVAERWTTTPDGRTWTFHLRADARWSNGDPVTAHDFAWSWRRLQEPDTASEYSAVLHVVRHAKALNQYGAQVARLRGDPRAEKPQEREGVLRRWDAVLLRHPAGVPFGVWKAFVADEANDLRNTVKGTSDPALLGPLSRNDGDLTAEEAKAVGAALRAEAERRAADLERARAHFGVDEGAFAKDDRTFVVELDVLAPYFLELTAFYVTVPVHRPTVERWGSDWFREGRLVGNGPFVLESWRVNEKIVLRKSPTYWGAADVSLRTVEALPYENASTALNLYLTGDVDWIPGNYPPDLIDQIRRRPDYHDAPGMIVYFYRLNTTRAPFDDVRVRKALAKAVDRARIVRAITRKGETPSTKVVPYGVPDYESPPDDLAFDPEAARRLLAEAGYGPGGRSMRRFTIVYNTQETHKKVAEFLAQDWKERLGLEVQVNNKEWQALLADVQRLEYDVERAGWIGDYRDPKTFLDMWITGDGNNETGWSDPVYDRLVALASEADRLPAWPAADLDALLATCREPDRLRARVEAVRAQQDEAGRYRAILAVRSQLFREAEARLLNDGIPIIPFYSYMVSGLVQRDVEGIHYSAEKDGRKVYNLQDDHPLRDVSTARSRDARR